VRSRVWQDILWAVANSCIQEMANCTAIASLKVEYHVFGGVAVAAGLKALSSRARATSLSSMTDQYFYESISRGIEVTISVIEIILYSFYQKAPKMKHFDADELRGMAILIAYRLACNPAKLAFRLLNRLGERAQYKCMAC
jgi:hypothetical protein